MAMMAMWKYGEMPRKGSIGHLQIVRMATFPNYFGTSMPSSTTSPKGANPRGFEQSASKP
jgi:hypothetical protein